MTITRVCYFCPRRLFEINRKIGVPAEGSIVRQTPDFLVFPDVAPLTVGHLLVVPRKHIFSSAQVPAHLAPELDRLIQDLRGDFERAYGAPPLVYEHGGEQRVTLHAPAAGPCIDHAHLHLLPDTMRLDGVIERFLSSGNARRSEPLEELSTREYVRVASQRTTHAFVVSGLPRQFLRQIWAVATGMPYATWQDAMGQAVVHERFRQTLDAFPMHTNRISTRFLPTPKRGRECA